MATTFLERAQSFEQALNLERPVRVDPQKWAVWVLDCWPEVLELVEAARWQSDQDAADEQIHDSTECEPNDCRQARLRIALDNLDKVASE